MKATQLELEQEKANDESCASDIERIRVLGGHLSYLPLLSRASSHCRAGPRGHSSPAS